ncbi:MAG: hypothetical protein HGB22_02775 [Chlorobiaceae bacterium]|nr:hypothetical protein [Chlorobiaceae bacterium]
MGLKWLFRTIYSVLFHPEAFWKETSVRRREINAMKDYAAPVIAMVQLCKLPFMAVPKAAMYLAVISFIVDVAVLYLLSGLLVSVLGHDRQESLQDDVLAILAFSLTPVWLAEPFYFTGTWRWLFISAALLHALLILRSGMRIMLEKQIPQVDTLFGKSALLVAVATISSFMLSSGLIRFFTSF